MYFSENMGEAEKAQAEVPKEYEKIKKTKIYQINYPLELPPVPRSDGYYQIPLEEKISLLYMGCQRCQLCNYRKHMVFWRGSQKAKLVFLGMAPGNEEDYSGLPFVGMAGKTLDMMLQAAGFDLEAVFINLVCCRPNDGKGAPKRDDPKISEMIACSQRLWFMLNMLKPHVVVALGRLAATMFWHDPKKFERDAPYEVVPNKLIVLQTFHPSYIQRKMREGEMFEYEAAIKFYRGLGDIIKKRTSVAFQFSLNY
jgi:DNA polymerase